MNEKLSVLIIDDEKDFCDVIVNILPLKIECVYTLQDAYAVLNQQTPDFILLDNNLPDGKGIDFLQEHTPLFITSRVIMMSADASDDLIHTARQFGVYEFLAKPFSLKKLREIIRPAFYPASPIFAKNE